MPIFKSRRPMKKKPMGAGKMGKKKPLKKRPVKHLNKRTIDKPIQPSIESTGMESLYLRDLVESEKIVVIVLTSGEQVRGHVRYYDKDIFSIGPVDGGPKMLLRKSGVRYMYEE